MQEVKRIKKTKYCVGDLNHKIKIMKRASDPFDTNRLQKKYDFTEEFSIFAGIKSTNGITFLGGIAVQDNSTDLFIARYRSDISSELFIEYKDLRFEIISIKNDNRNNGFMEIRTRCLGSIDLKGATK